MKKRLTQILLALTISASMLVPAWAAGSPQLTIDADETSVEKGDTFSVLVKMEDNPGFESLQVDVIYDTDILTCTSIEAAKILKQDGILYAGNKDNDGKATFAAINVDPIEGDGALVKLTFRAEQNGSTNLDVNLIRMISDGNRISANEDSQKIEVIGDVEVPSGGTTQVPPAEQPEVEKTDVSFIDVPKTHWAYSYIQNVVKQGLFTGISNNQFGPDMNVTRGMFVTVLYSYAGAPAAEPSTFSDVSSSAWYTKCVSWANEQGIVSGIGDNKFGPELSITREQLALILYQFAKGTSPGTEAYVRMFYPDGKDIHDWALTAMSWAVNEGLISGKTGNRLAPQDTATRAEVAVIMQNFVNLTK